VGVDDAEGFVFDLDGTFVQRGRAGMTVLPGAVEVVAAIRASGRPLAIFTNASHVAPRFIAAELREAGLEIADDEVLTPICSTMSYLRARFPGRPVMTFATPATRERLTDEGGIELVDGDGAAAVFVAHPDAFAFEQLETAARAIVAGAPLLTASFVPAYSGADGPIFSRGAMVTAALAKASGARPKVTGKPSKAAVAETVARMGVPSDRLVVVGDDVVLDIGLGHLGGSHTILVRSGISAGVDPARLPASQRPHESIASVADLLGRL
jgi:HAD superfamily hydrolase (TIGR01450 family)